MYFPNRINRLLLALSVVFAVIGATNRTASAQRQNVEQLQKQMREIQRQLNRISDDENPFGEDSGTNRRVKSVGSQRTRKPVVVPDDDELLIRLYDLSDIFVSSPNYPAQAPTDLGANGLLFRQGQSNFQSSSSGGGGFGGGGGGGVFNIAPRATAILPSPRNADQTGLQSSQVSLDQLVSAIQQTVSPDKWGDDEDEARVQLLGNTMLITADSGMHDQINNLLNLFRGHWGKLRTISIQTYWIRDDEGKAKSLLTGEHQEATGAGVVDEERWTKFLESAQAEDRLAFSATLTGHNNQTVHTLSGRQRQIIVDATPIESVTFHKEPENDDGESMTSEARKTIGFRPVHKNVHDGAAIQVTPMATRGGNFVVVDLHARVNEFIKPAEDAPQPSIYAYTESGEKAEVKLGSSEYIAYRLNTTIRCPKEKVVLAGSMTFDSNSSVDQPNLYLFVRATIHTIQEDKSDWVAEDSSKKKK